MMEIANLNECQENVNIVPKIWANLRKFYLVKFNIPPEIIRKVATG